MPGHGCETALSPDPHSSPQFGVGALFPLPSSSPLWLQLQHSLFLRKGRNYSQQSLSLKTLAWSQKSQMEEALFCVHCFRNDCNHCCIYPSNPALCTCCLFPDDCVKSLPLALLNPIFPEKAQGFWDVFFFFLLLFPFFSSSSLLSPLTWYLTHCVLTCIFTPRRDIPL